MTTFLGCIADDFTGATDLASLLARSGASVSLRIGVPDEPPTETGTAEFEIIALKIRTIPVAEAVAEGHFKARLFMESRSHRGLSNDTSSYVPAGFRVELVAAEPLIQDVARAIDIGVTPYTLKFFELINSPQGPWLQMLQRVYYSDDDISTVIADAKAEMESIINE